MRIHAVNLASQAMGQAQPSQHRAMPVPNLGATPVRGQAPASAAGGWAPIRAPLPAPGKPIQGKPIQGKPAFGRPIQGKPVQGRPTVGNPASGRPVVGRSQRQGADDSFDKPSPQQRSSNKGAPRK